MTLPTRLNSRNPQRRIYAGLTEMLRVVAESAGAGHHKALKGEFSGLYSTRIGDYRAIYSLYHQERVLVVERIGHRSDIYYE